VEYLKVLLGNDCALLGYYASISGNSLPTFVGPPISFKGSGNSLQAFRDNLSVQSSRVNNRVMVIPYRRFGTTYRSSLQGSIIE